MILIRLKLRQIAWKNVLRASTKQDTSTTITTMTNQLALTASLHTPATTIATPLLTALMVVLFLPLATICTKTFPQIIHHYFMARTLTEKVGTKFQNQMSAFFGKTKTTKEKASCLNWTKKFVIWKISGPLRLQLLITPLIVLCPPQLNLTFQLLNNKTKWPLGHVEKM